MNSTKAWNIQNHKQTQEREYTQMHNRYDKVVYFWRAY